MHARNRAERRARFLGAVFAMNTLAVVVGERYAGETTLLRAVVHEAFLADVQVAPASTTAPVVGLLRGEVRLEALIEACDAEAVELLELA